MLTLIRDLWTWLCTPRRTFRSVVEELVTGLRNGDIVLDEGHGEGSDDEPRSEELP